MKRWWLIALGLVLTFLVLSVWQKCTAWEDRYCIYREYSNPGDPVCDKLMVDTENGTFATERGQAGKFSALSVCWNGVSDLVRHEFYRRDFLYLPPYFRWWYGGK